MKLTLVCLVLPLAPAPWLEYPCAASITLADDVTELPADAFKTCTELTSLNLPSGLLTIGEGAFEDSGLTWIDIPEGVTSIGARAFQRAPLVGNITIPDTVTTVGDYAFYQSTLEGVIIGTGVTSIGQYAFHGSLISHLYIPGNVTTMGDNAFSSTQLRTINFGEGAGVAIPRYAFHGNYQLEEVHLPASVTSIAGWSFQSNPMLHTLTFGSPSMLTQLVPVSNVESWAPFSSLAVTNISLPEGLTTVGRFCHSCNSLVEVALPLTLTVVDQNAFKNMPNLVSIGHGSMSTTLPNATHTIGANAFQSCPSLPVITVPYGCTVGLDAFSADGCAHAKSRIVTLSR